MKDKSRLKTTIVVKRIAQDGSINDISSFPILGSRWGASHLKWVLDSRIGYAYWHHFPSHTTNDITSRGVCDHFRTT